VDENQKTEKRSGAWKTDEIRQLIRRAEKGDAKAVPELRDLLINLPSFVDLLGGNLAQQAELSLLSASFGQNLCAQEALKRKMELLRQELTGSNATPLERLLAERIALCWLALYQAEALFHQQAQDLSIHQVEYWQNRIDRAHRRYLSAIRTLATVRKLAVPVLQVNIAKKQVNIAGSGETEGG
jgi:hypothetical protein